ncbi:actin cytoskeleton and mitosis protein [Coemansia sp. Benny D115]|nr:actin cytoskeleton and mitosis protein [Coemansia sp. Benny D115]
MDFARPAAEEELLKAQRRERFSNTAGEQRYRALVSARTQRRQKLIAQGVLGTAGALHEARKIVGTCELMCPEFEREERELKNNLAPQEVVEGTRRADPRRTVKTFHRSAAGNEEPLPEDLRTPAALLRTLDYLVDDVIGADRTLMSCHGFVRDRTRSIRQDFTIQNIRTHQTVAACERIARFHILSLHVLCGHKGFEEQQDMEQLRNTLKTLVELYDDHRKAGIRCANEPEFSAYYIVAHLRDSDAKRVAERMPRHIFLAPIVQQALKLHMLAESSGVLSSRQDPGNLFAAQNMPVQFFRAVASPATPFLLACLAEYRFPSIRRAALKAMNQAFPFQEGREYPLEEFAAMLAFDSTQQVRDFCALFSVGVSQKGVRLGERHEKRLLYREPEQKLQRTAPNLRVVGAKYHATPMHVINSDLDPALLAPVEMTRIRPPLSSIAPPLDAAAAGGRDSIGSAAAFGKQSMLPQQQAPSPFKTDNTGFKAQGPSVWPTANKPSGSTPVSAFDAFKPVSAQSQQPAASEVDTKQQAQKPQQPATAQAPAPLPSPFAAPAPRGSALTTAASFVPLSKKPVKSVTFDPSIPAPPLTPDSSATKAHGFAALHSSTQATQTPAATAPSAIISTKPQPAAALKASLPAPQTTIATATATAPAAKSETNVSATTATVTSQAPANVVWHAPRKRINWTELTNTLYNDLIGSLLSTVAQPLVTRASENASAALALADDIAESVVSYVSAFIAYEESYRFLLLAQADSFRRKSTLRLAFSRWSMDTVVRQQDRALQLQYADDLERLVDSEYILYNQLHKRSDSGSQLAAPIDHESVGAAASESASASLTLPADFWESLHVGRDGFDYISRVLKRYNSQSIEARLAVVGAQDPNSVLSAWLWWQIDPAAITNESRKQVTYTNASETLGHSQSLLIADTNSTANDADDEVGASLQTFAASAMVVLLSPEPISDYDVRGNFAGSALGARIAATVCSVISDGHTRGSMPVLFVFWSSEAKATKHVRRLITQQVPSANNKSKVPPIHTLALDVSLARGQLASGIKWLCKQVALNRRNTLVRVPQVYGRVVDAMVLALGRLRDCILHRYIDQVHAKSIFNIGVDITNKFISVLNTNLLCFADHPSALEFPRLSDSKSLGPEYFGGLKFIDNAVAGTSIDRIISETDSDCNNTNRNMSARLTRYLAALEFAAKYQLDILQHSFPSQSAYVDFDQVSGAIDGAEHLSADLTSRADQMFQKQVQR